MKKNNIIAFNEALRSKSAARRVMPAEFDNSKSLQEENIMVKKVSFVDSETLLSEDVLATISTAGLDGMEFEEWLVEKYGSNDRVRQVIRDAIEGSSDEEATLYVPEHKPVSMVALPKTNVIKFLDKTFHEVAPEIIKTSKTHKFSWGCSRKLADRVDDKVSNLLEALFYFMAKNLEAYETEKCHACWGYILECAWMYFWSSDKTEDSCRAFVLDTAVFYAGCGPDVLVDIVANEYRNMIIAKC